MTGPLACPYDLFRPANLAFCERDVCGWITQPANTWTNVGFFIVAAAIIRLARRDGAPRAGLLGPIAALTGLGSIAAHGTGTLIGQLIDQNVMFLESSLFVVLNLARWRLPPRALIVSYAGMVAISVALLLRFETLGIALFIAHVVAFLAVELAAAARGPARASYRALIAAGITFAISYALWWLDKLGVVCAPDNHVMTAHGGWHFLGALSFYFFYRHFAQFEHVAAL